MTKMIQPRSFFHKGGKRAVLLLHSFTGNTRDVKRIGEFLNTHGYTCMAPLYDGHGEPAEILIQYTPEDWWESVKSSYNQLQSKGYENIAVIGVSLGGVFALHTAETLDVTGIVTMSVPMKRTESELMRRVTNYAATYKQLEGHDKNQIESDIEVLKQTNPKGLTQFVSLIDQTMSNLQKIEKPVFILYGKEDEPLYEKSANFIYDHVSSEIKTVTGYENSKHLMTVGKNRLQIQDDILAFLESLDW